MPCCNRATLAQALLGFPSRSRPSGQSHLACRRECGLPALLDGYSTGWPPARKAAYVAQQLSLQGSLDPARCAHEQNGGLSHGLRLPVSAAFSHVGAVTVAAGAQARVSGRGADGGRAGGARLVGAARAAGAPAGRLLQHAGCGAGPPAVPVRCPLGVHSVLLLFEE